MNKKLIAVTVLASIPVIALAVDIGTLTFKGLVAYMITDIIRPITVLILALAVVYFLWNIAEIIRAGKQGEELAELKTKAFWGIVALFIMASLWGLVQILVNTFVPRAGISTFDTGSKYNALEIDTGSEYNALESALNMTYDTGYEY